MNQSTSRILMVDDDEEDRELLQDVFEELGYGRLIHLEENGEQALAYLNGLGGMELPCLIVLDLNMPRLGGRQTLQYIKAQPNLRHITVVIFSTSLNPMEKEECLALGAHSYVVKPVTYHEAIQIAQEFYDLCGT